MVQKCSQLGNLGDEYKEFCELILFLCKFKVISDIYIYIYIYMLKITELLNS